MNGGAYDYLTHTGRKIERGGWIEKEIIRSMRENEGSEKGRERKRRFAQMCVLKGPSAEAAYILSAILQREDREMLRRKKVH